MTLSPRASQFIGWTRGTTLIKEARPLRDWLSQAGLPLYPAILDFQETLAGVEYYLPSGIAVHWSLEHVDEADQAFALWREPDGSVLFPCTYCEGSPMPFYLGTVGTLYTADRVLIAIASSAAKAIESDAMLDEMVRTGSAWTSFTLSEQERSEGFLRAIREFEPIEEVAEASDEYTHWWRGDGWYLCQRVSWDSSSHRLTVFGRAKMRADAQRLVQRVGGIIL